jgi:hypothetical protein
MAFDFNSFGETEDTSLDTVSPSSGFNFNSFGTQAPVVEVPKKLRSDGARIS